MGLAGLFAVGECEEIAAVAKLENSTMRFPSGITGKCHCSLGALGTDFKVTGPPSVPVCSGLSLACRTHPKMLLAQGHAHWIICLSFPFTLGQGFSSSALVSFIGCQVKFKIVLMTCLAYTY